MARKHLHKRTAKGHTYESYRKSITYKGQQFRPEAKSKADWEARVAAWKKEVDSSFLASDPKLTVNQLAEIFKNDARTTKKPKTIEMREMILRLYVLPYIGHMKLRQVRSENVEKAYDAAQGVSASILEQTHKVTNRMFNFAIETGGISYTFPFTNSSRRPTVGRWSSSSAVNNFLRVRIKPASSYPLSPGITSRNAAMIRSTCSSVWTTDG